MNSELNQELPPSYDEVQKKRIQYNLFWNEKSDEQGVQTKVAEAEKHTVWDEKRLTWLVCNESVGVTTSESKNELGI